MNMDGALANARSGLANINHQLNIIANNVANANTPDYSAEIGTQRSMVAGTAGMGVRTEATGRAINLALQQSMYRQDTIVAGLTTETAHLSAIDAVLGTPGQNNDLSSLTGQLRDAFSGLLGDPANGARQAGAVVAAGNLTSGINALSGAYTQQRQAAQNDIVSAVANANAALNQIGSFSNQIIAARASGLSTADLENLRDAAVHGLSQVVDIKILAQSDGDLFVATVSGTQLPTRAPSGPLRTLGATLAPEASWPNGGLPGITLNGADITTRLGGGQLGAAIAMRDQTLPSFQAELDEFAFSLATRYDAQGLTLFTGPDGVVPTGGGTPVQSTYTGFAALVQVNISVAANPAQTRDGSHDVADDPAGPSGFTVNPPGGPAGSTAMINRILKFALGGEVRSGVAQTLPSTVGLGSEGNLNAAFVPPPSLIAHASALVSSQSAVSATAANRLTTEKSVQSAVTRAFAAGSAVNMDTEMAHMIQLQNAYAANARIITTVQNLLTQLLQAIR